MRSLTASLALAVAALVAADAAHAAPRSSLGPATHRITFGLERADLSFSLSVNADPARSDWTGSAVSTARLQLPRRAMPGMAFPVASNDRTSPPAAVPVMPIPVTVRHDVRGRFTQHNTFSPDVEFNCGGSINQQTSAGVRIVYRPRSQTFLIEPFSPFVGFSCLAADGNGVAYQVAPGYVDGTGVTVPLAAVIKKNATIRVPFRLPADFATDAETSGDRRTVQAYGEIVLRPKVSTVRRRRG